MTPSQNNADNNETKKKVPYHFGEKLRQMREHKGYTLKYVAQMAGVSESLVSQIERNHVSPAIDTLLSLADVLDINLEFLFEEYRRQHPVQLIRRGERAKMAEGDVDYEELSKIWCIPFEMKKLNYAEIFGNTNPVTVEIGFGMGTATALIAEANPDMNYIGIEVHTPGVGKLLGEIRSRNLKNLYIIQFDALDVLEQMITDGSVAAFHVFFPDPWPKKKHHKRRLVKRPNTELFARKLSEGGYFYMVTDWKEYAEFALEELKETAGLENKYSLFAEHQSWRPETKFEAKGIAAEREITELMFLKKTLGNS